jgi:hypothetical protein
MIVISDFVHISPNVSLAGGAYWRGDKHQGQTVIIQGIK